MLNEMTFDQVQGKYGSAPVELANFGGDKGAVAQFYTGRVPMNEESAAEARAEGKPDFTEATFVRIEFSGDTLKVFDQPARLRAMGSQPSDIERFPRAWAAFQAGETERAGTPLVRCDGISIADAKRLNSLSIYSVEDLAAVSDGNLSMLGLGARPLREAARAFLIARDDTGSELAELRAQIAALTASQVNKGGRPRKETVDAQ